MSSATVPVVSHFVDDPCRACVSLPLRQTFYPLGFPVEIESNHPAVLAIAKAYWPVEYTLETTPPLKLRLAVAESASPMCTAPPVTRAQHHLLTIIADAENFVSCDLREGFAFGWVTSATIAHELYFRLFFLEGAIMTLLCAGHVTPFHAGCVGFAGRSLLLNGLSGAGKSTLAYACARDGWTYTSDDACYLLWNKDALVVRGNSRQFRFRPAARELFPELKGYGVTPRIVGKPSIEVPSSNFPNMRTSSETHVDAIITLSRHTSPTVELIPMKREETMNMLEESLLPVPYMNARQRPTLKRMAPIPSFTLYYRDLDPAIERLRELTEKLALSVIDQAASDKEFQSAQSA